MQQCAGRAKCVETWRLADGLFVDGKVGDIFIWEVRGRIGELQAWGPECGWCFAAVQTE
jgi:hypothetical protein